MSDTLRKLSAEDLQYNIDRCCEFKYGNLTNYISELAHRVKYFGEAEFIKEYATKEDLDYSGSLGKAHTCFLVALIEYLCNKNSIEIPDVIKAEADIKMDFILFHEGNVIEYKIIEDTSVLEESYTLAIEEFLNRNLVITDEEFDVY